MGQKDDRKCIRNAVCLECYRQNQIFFFKVIIIR